MRTPVANKIARYDFVEVIFFARRDFHGRDTANDGSPRTNEIEDFLHHRRVAGVPRRKERAIRAAKNQARHLRKTINQFVFPAIIRENQRSPIRDPRFKPPAGSFPAERFYRSLTRSISAPTAFSFCSIFSYPRSM